MIWIANTFSRLVAENIWEVQFVVGNNNSCPIQNIFKDKYLNKKTGGIKERNPSMFNNIEDDFDELKKIDELFQEADEYMEGNGESGID